MASAKPPVFSFDESVAYACIGACNDFNNALLGIQKLMGANGSAFLLDEANTIPIPSGRGLVNNQFNVAATGLADSILQLSEVMGNMMQTFGAGAKLIMNTEDSNSMLFTNSKNVGKPFESSPTAVSIMPTRMPEGSWSPTGSTGGKIGVSDSYQTTPQTATEDPNGLDWQQYLEPLSHMKGQPVADLGTKWLSAGDALGSAYSTLMGAITNNLGDDWQGNSAKSVQQAFTDLQGEISYLTWGMNITGNMLVYTGGWMDQTAKAMPPCPPPSAGGMAIKYGPGQSNYSSDPAQYVHPDGFGAFEPDKSGSYVVDNPANKRLTYLFYYQDPFSGKTVATAEYYGPVTEWMVPDPNGGGLASMEYAQTYSTLIGELTTHYQDAFATFYVPGFKDTTPNIPMFQPKPKAAPQLGATGATDPYKTQLDQLLAKLNGQPGAASPYTGGIPSGSGSGSGTPSSGSSATSGSHYNAALANQAAADAGKTSTPGITGPAGTTGGQGPTAGPSGAGAPAGATGPGAYGTGTSPLGGLSGAGATTAAGSSASSSDPTSMAQQALSSAQQIAQQVGQMGQQGLASAAAAQSQGWQDQAKAAMDKLATGKLSGVAGGGGGAGGGGAAEGAAEMSGRLSGVASEKLFPRAASAITSEGALAAESEAAMAARAGMGMGSGYPPGGGMGGAGRAGGEEKERQRAQYLNSKKHIEEALGKAPGTVKPVLEQ